MPKRLPTYSLHAASGQARVWLGGKSHYLGPYDSPQSRIAYAALISQYAGGVAADPLKPTGEKDNGPTVNVIANAFLEHAKRYYVKNGKQTAEVDCIRSAMHYLCTPFGHVLARDFGPMSLKAVRQKMIESKGRKSHKPLCRDFINKSMEPIEDAKAIGVILAQIQDKGASTVKKLIRYTGICRQRLERLIGQLHSEGRITSTTVNVRGNDFEQYQITA